MTDYAHLDIYTNPVDYDRESAPFDPQGTMLQTLAAQAAGPILELGCGTGRVTIPLAQQGFDMTGLEVVPQMIEHARKKAADRPIRWIHADVRSFQLSTRFALIFTYGTVFNHLLQRGDQEAMLARVREHLVPGGRFMIDVGFKRPSAMTNSEEVQEWYRYTDADGREVQVSGTDAYDHMQQMWTQTFYRRWLDNGQTLKNRLTMRYFLPQEIESLLYYNGFTILDRFGDWTGGPLSIGSYQQIYLCKQRD